MLTVIFSSSDIFISTFILIFANFSKVLYYSYDQETKQDFSKRT